MFAKDSRTEINSALQFIVISNGINKEHESAKKKNLKLFFYSFLIYCHMPYITEQPFQHLLMTKSVHC